MNAIVSTSQSAEEYLELGLRDQWHPVLASWEVAANPVGITRLGENIVVWRDAEGQVHALEDRCPHRGARLSLGWNLGDRVACWYHGVEVGGVPHPEAAPVLEHEPDRPDDVAACSRRERDLADLERDVGCEGGDLL